ncbi:hypothetical protein FGIG_12059 [Fasciola gigantica]|uniref:Uncharacterized protein n=1 Tax=Fasciola gigantica TaxID=46835 RepID=A0A504YNC9_FASGI|nr:hypothetical protein FGIG_12059 [Fasciola gigantica]
MEVKTRIRKQLIREVIKKKFTPRRRIPLIHFGRSHSDRAMITSRSRNDATDAQSSSNYLQTSDVSSTTGNAQGATETNTGPTTVAQEQRVQREVEMLLGRHAQPVSYLDHILRCHSRKAERIRGNLRWCFYLCKAAKLNANPTRGKSKWSKTSPIHKLDLSSL